MRLPAAVQTALSGSIFDLEVAVVLDELDPTYVAAFGAAEMQKDEMDSPVLACCIEDRLCLEVRGDGISEKLGRESCAGRI